MNLYVTLPQRSGDGRLWLHVAFTIVARRFIIRLSTCPRGTFFIRRVALVIMALVATGCDFGEPDLRYRCSTILDRSGAVVGANHEIPCDAVASNVALAVMLFEAHTRLNTDYIGSIWVREEYHWEIVGGQQVVGSTNPMAWRIDHDAEIQLGCPMRALAHEFGHVLAEQINGDPDYNHARWPDMGIPALEDSYHRDMTAIPCP